MGVDASVPHNGASTVRTKVFVSYSRKDKIAVDQITSRLAAHGEFQIFIDTDDILPTEEWRGRLRDMITQADTIIFCLSPDSAVSETCAWEASHAVSLSKRIVPVVVRTVSGPVPAPLASLNWLFLTDDVERCLSSLIVALHTDIKWVREHTRMGVLADHWHRSGKTTDLLLRGAEVAAAQHWLAFRSSTAPELNELTIEYIASSATQLELETRLETERLKRIDREKLQFEVITQAKTQQKRIWRYAAVVVTVLVLLVIIRTVNPKPLETLQLATFDALNQASPRAVDPDYPVKIVAIDEESLQIVGPWPWPRKVFAQLIEALRKGGARVIAIDLSFDESDVYLPARVAKAYAGEPLFEQISDKVSQLPNFDELLGSAIERAPVVLAGNVSGDTRLRSQLPKFPFGLAYVGDDPGLYVMEFKAGLMPLPSLAAHAQGLGHGLTMRNGGVIRESPLFVSINGKLLPSLALETLRVAINAKSYVIESSGAGGDFGTHTGIRSVRVGNVLVPTTATGGLWLRLSPKDDHRSIPAHRVLSPDFDGSEIAGRGVIIGTAAPTIGSSHLTAIGYLSGGEIVAQELEQMLSGRHAVRPDFADGAETLWMFAFGIPIALLMRRLHALLSALVVVVAIGGSFYLSRVAYDLWGFLFDSVYPSIGVAIMYLVAVLSSYLLASSERAALRSTLQRTE